MKKFASILCLLLAACSASRVPPVAKNELAAPEPEKVAKLSNPGRVIHVMVALCDNEFQGIVPVPAHLGNGEDAAKNLYWGAAFGVKTHFLKSRNWKLVEAISNPSDDILERLVFRHRTLEVYLVADAYRGSRMRQTIDAFLGALSGNNRENVGIGDVTLQISGGADLVAFVGHDGLMDFDLEKKYNRADSTVRDAIVLACASRNYFWKPIKETGANPLLWTSNLMAPEAYVLHDGLDGWVLNEEPEKIRERAAAAYAKYQRISLRSAKGIFVTGY